MALFRRLQGIARLPAGARGFRAFLLLLLAIAALVVLPLVLSFSLCSLRYLRYSREEIANTARLNLASAMKLAERFQDTIVQAATLVLMDPALGEIASIDRLDDVRGSFDAYLKLSRVVSLLTSMTYIPSLRVASVYFYVDGADYIITSDQGPVRLTGFPDAGYREVYESLLRNPHSSVWTVRNVPVQTISVDEVVTAAYLTYANMANPIVSRVRGAIFVNTRETVLSDLINTRDFDKGGRTFIVDAAGTILSHVDKTRISTNISESTTTARLADAQGGGLLPTRTVDAGRGSLFVTAYSERTSWTYVSEHSLDELTGRVRALMRTSILVISAIVLVGSAVVLYIASRLSAPLRKLMGSLAQWNPAGVRRRGPAAEPRNRFGNEFEYLLEAFRSIREREAILHRTIDKSRDRLWESYIVDLLRGDGDKYAEEPFADSDVVPAGGWFRVLTFTVDRKAEVEARHSLEQRLSCLTLLSTECRRVFSDVFHCAAVLIEGGVSAIVGSGEEDLLDETRIGAAVAGIQERFAPTLGATLTVGMSGRHHEGIPAISRAYEESLEAARRKLVAGYGEVHVWGPATASEARYPYEIEAKLLNCLRAGDLPGAEAALGRLFSSLETMPCDDILHSVQQLCAVLARFMKEGDIRDAGARSIFDELASRETLAEMRELLSGVCRVITMETGGAAVLVDRILDYVRSHLTAIIDFEAMAESVGISYSYMRRLMKEHTGRGILEHQHRLRVEEAERLLSDGGCSISAMAKSLGYNNIQSFERFFKKYTGVSAHEYRRLQRYQIQRSVSKPTVYKGDDDPS